jgi:hypothetical protein
MQTKKGWGSWGTQFENPKYCPTNEEPIQIRE